MATFYITYILFCCVFTSTYLARQPTLRPGIEPGTLRLTVARSNQLSYQSFEPFYILFMILPAWSGVRTHACEHKRS